MPPVTAERSPPDSRITGADSPVIADSSTEPTPSIIVAVGRDDLPRLDDDDVAALQLRRRHRLGRRAGARSWSCASRAARSPAPCRGPRRSPRRSSRRARSARARSRSWRRTRGCRCDRATSSRTKIPVVITLPSSTMNITGLLSLEARVELRERVADRREHELAREDAAEVGGHQAPPRLVESEIELEDVDARLAEEAEAAAVGVLLDQLLHGRERQVPDGGDAPRLQLRVGGRDVGVDTRGGRRDGVDRDVVDRQARVVRRLELQDRRSGVLRRSWRGRGSSGRGSRTSSPPAL